MSKVTWDEKVCSHAGKCVGGLPEVFKIEDGNFEGNGRPGLNTSLGENWSRALSDTAVGNIWLDARNIGNKYNGYHS